MHCLTALWIPSAWPLLLCSALEWTEKMIPWCCLNLFDTMIGCISCACKCLCCLVVNNSIAAKTALYLTRPSQVDKNVQITSACCFVPCFPMYFIRISLWNSALSSLSQGIHLVTTVLSDSTCSHAEITESFQLWLHVTPSIHGETLSHPTIIVIYCDHVTHLAAVTGHKRSGKGAGSAEDSTFALRQLHWCQQQRHGLPSEPVPVTWILGTGWLCNKELTLSQLQKNQTWKGQHRHRHTYTHTHHWHRGVGIARQ